MLRFLALIPVLLVSMIEKAQAATYDLFKTDSSETDYMINYILKPVFGYGQDLNQANPFSTFSTVFLSGLLILAAILLCYGWFTSLNDTAQTGALMGSQHGGRKLTFLTLRSSVGLGLLMPLGNAGICAIQYIVLWIAAQGVLFANVTWESFAENPTLGTLTYSTDLKKTLFKNASNIVLSEVCYKMLNEEYGADARKKVPTKQIFTNNGYTVNYGYKEYHGMRDVCGTIKFTEPSKEDMKEALKRCNPANKNNTGTGDISLMGGCLSKHNTELLKLNQNVQKKAVEKWLGINGNGIGEQIATEFLQKIAETDQMKYESEDGNVEGVRQKNTQILTWLHEKFQTYVNETYDEIKKGVEDLENQLKGETETEFRDAMTKYGFASVGSWYFKLATELSEKSNFLNKSYPVSREVEVEKDFQTMSMDGFGGGALYPDLEPLPKSVEIKMKTISNYLRNVEFNMDYSPNKNETNTFNNEAVASTVNKALGREKESVSDDPKEIEKKIKEVFPIDRMIDDTRILLTGEQNMTGTFLLDKLGRATNSTNPILIIKLWGDNLFSVSSTFIITSIGLNALGVGLTHSGLGWFGGGVGGGALMALSGIVQSAAFALLVPAFMMAFYFPLMPFLLWIGSVFGWVVLMVEAMFGAPMWLVTFLSPDVDGFVGKLGQGYKLILAIFLRPVLMVLGFLVSLHLISPIMQFTNIFFAMAIESVWNTSGVLASIFGYFAIVIMYCVVFNKTAIQIFHLIHKLPDTLLNWIGGPGAQLGQYASGVEQAVGAGLGAGLGVVPQMVGNAQRSMIDGIRMNEAASRDRKNKALEGSREQDMKDRNSAKGLEGTAETSKMENGENQVINAAERNAVNNNSHKSAQEQFDAGQKARQDAQEQFEKSPEHNAQKAQALEKDFNDVAAKVNSGEVSSRAAGLALSGPVFERAAKRVQSLGGQFRTPSGEGLTYEQAKQRAAKGEQIAISFPNNHATGGDDGNGPTGGGSGGGGSSDFGGNDNSTNDIQRPNFDISSNDVGGDFSGSASSGGDYFAEGGSADVGYSGDFSSSTSDSGSFDSYDPNVMQNNYDYSAGGEGGANGSDFAMGNYSESSGVDVDSTFNNVEQAVQNLNNQGSFEGSVVHYERTPSGLKQVNEIPQSQFNNAIATSKGQKTMKANLGVSMQARGKNNVVKVFKNAAERQNFESQHTFK